MAQVKVFDLNGGRNFFSKVRRSADIMYVLLFTLNTNIHMYDLYGVDHVLTLIKDINSLVLLSFILWSFSNLRILQPFILTEHVKYIIS